MLAFRHAARYFDAMAGTIRSGAIIIGGGPAGLFAAIRLAAARELAAAGAPGILLLEKRERPGRKLLLSGSGQCNITHEGEMSDFLGHYGGGPKPESASRFLKPALFGFTNKELLAWFRACGIEFEAEENGKIFPKDRRASSILKILLAEAGRLGVEIKTEAWVWSVERTGPDGFVARAEVPEAGPAEYIAPAVLIATGGASYPRTGSTGDGYALAAALGHEIVPPRASLVSIAIREFPLATLAGLSFKGAGLSLRRGGKRVLSREGDLLITHEGLSGPLILDASRHIEAGDTIELRFIATTIEEFRASLDAALKTSPRRLARTVLAEIGLTKNMAERFCDLAGIGPEETAASLPRAKREALCVFACANPFEVARLGSLDTAMATAGGVSLAEVNPGTMESRLAPGLFFAGEVLDIDGDTGGYNLQAAFSTGALAAAAMAGRIHRYHE